MQKFYELDIAMHRGVDECSVAGPASGVHISALLHQVLAHWHVGVGCCVDQSGAPETLSQGGGAGIGGGNKIILVDLHTLKAVVIINWHNNTIQMGTSHLKGCTLPVLLPMRNT